MTDVLQPYEKFNPGDLIAAEKMNGLQVSVRRDIQTQVDQVKRDLDEHKAAPVDAAKFGGKTPEEWTAQYDKRYVQRAEIKNGWGEYRRYFKQLDRPTPPDPAIIEHNLRRYPTVSVFELERLTNFFDKDRVPEPAKILSEDTSTDVRFVVYYAGRRDQLAEELRTRGADTAYWGDTLDLLLEQFELEISPNQLFDDVLNDLWGKMFDPGLDQDNFNRTAYGHSRYIQNELLGKNRTVQELKTNGMWNDLRMAMRPKLIPTSVGFGDVANDAEKTTVDVFHLSQNALEIKSTKPINLMVLLRT